MEKFLKYSFNIAAFLLLVSLLASCSDDPNSVGNALIPENDKLNLMVIDSQSEGFEQSFISFQKDSLYFGSSGRILLGNYKNISSEILISFFIDLPDSIIESFENNEDIVLSDSWFKMYPNYWIGDSSNFRFQARKINEHWTSISLDEDSVNAIHSSLGGDLIEEFDYNPGDSVITFSIDQTVVEEWVHGSYDDSYPTNNGILLDPSSSNGIAGFQALSTYPISTYPLLFLEFTKSGEIIDTVTAIPKLDIHLPTGDRIDDPTNSILLQGAINVRGKLKFDIESVPSNIVVNSAILDLYYDDVNSFEGTTKTDTIAVSYFYDSATDSVYVPYGKYPIVRENGKYSGELRQFVQRWLDAAESGATEFNNEGMEVKLSDEARNVAAISIYGSNHPNESLRPRLTIYYTSR